MRPTLVNLKSLFRNDADSPWDTETYAAIAASYAAPARLTTVRKLCR